MNIAVPCGEIEGCDHFTNLGLNYYCQIEPDDEEGVCRKGVGKFLKFDWPYLGKFIFKQSNYLFLFKIFFCLLLQVTANLSQVEHMGLQII